MKIKKKENIFVRIFITLLLLLVILYCVKNISLIYFGKTTTGYITSTSQIREKQSKKTGGGYQNTANYYFMVNDKKYEGSVSYKTDMPIVRKEDQEKEIPTIVQYFDFFPYLNTLKKYNENTVLGHLITTGIIIVCIIGISTVNKVKLKKVKKDKKNSSTWICDCGNENDSKYCEICGKER